jgi:hypothetical protein
MHANQITGSTTSDSQKQRKPLSYSFLLDSDATTNEGFTAMFGSLFVTGDDYRDTVCVDKKDVCVD